MIDACFVGHVAIDHINHYQTHGGSSLFGALLAVQLNLKTAVVTSAASDFSTSDYANLEWFIQKSNYTTNYDHAYVRDNRVSSLRKKSDPIDPKKISLECQQSNLVMLGPITDEITPNMLSLFSTPWLGLTPQGWFRHFDASGKMKASRSLFGSLPKKIKLIVVSEDDIKNDPTAWNWIKSFAEIAVRTNGKNGYVISNQGPEKKYKPIEIMEEVNPTGCGDIFATSVLILLSKGISPQEACLWAGHAAGLACTQKSMFESIKVAADFLKSKF